MSAYTTTIEIVRNGEAHELEIEVAYRIHPGDRGDYYQPPSDATAEIEDISVVGIDGKKYPAPWLVDLFCDDQDILSLCFVDARDRSEYAAEQQAEARREAPRMIAIIANRPKVGPRVFTYVCERSAPKRGDRPARIRGERYPFSVGGWARKWAKAKQEAGIDDFRFHDLRHTAATRVTRAVGNLKVTQRLLGHTNIATTARYTHASDGDVAKALLLTESRNSPDASSSDLPERRRNASENG